MLTSQALHAGASRSARWAVLQSVGKQGIDLLVFLLLARLVAPQAFGLVAMAAGIVVLVTVISEMGLGDALIQKAELSGVDLDTAFWAAVGIGLSCTCVLLVSAPFAASLYHHPELAEILRALSPLFLFASLNLVPQALLQRDLAFKPLALRALAGSLLGGLSGTAVAVAGGGAWAMVTQQLVSALVGLAGLWYMSPWRPQFKFSRASARTLYAFSSHVLGARTLNVLASKADDLAVGLVLGPLALGFYSIACRLLLALEQIFCQGVDAVALSALSRAGSSRDEMRAIFRKATSTAALWAFPVFGGAIALAPEVIALLVGPTWAPSVPLLQILLVAGLLHSVMHFNHAVFKACGRPEITMRIALASTLLNVVTLVIALQFGIEAVAISYVARTALLGPVGVQLACRMVGLSLADYAKGLIRPALCFAVALGALVLCRSWLGTPSPDFFHLGVHLAVEVFASAASYAASWALSGLILPAPAARPSPASQAAAPADSPGKTAIG